MERVTAPRKIAASSGFLLAVLGVLWSLYVLVMPPLLAGITGSASSGTERLSWVIGAAYAVPSILCAVAGLVGAVVIGRSRTVLGGILVAAGWVCFVALVGLFVVPSWLA